MTFWQWIKTVLLFLCALIVVALAVLCWMFATACTWPADGWYQRIETSQVQIAGYQKETAETLNKIDAKADTAAKKYFTAQEVAKAEKAAQRRNAALEGKVGDKTKDIPGDKAPMNGLSELLWTLVLGGLGLGSYKTILGPAIGGFLKRKNGVNKSGESA